MPRRAPLLVLLFLGLPAGCLDIAGDECPADLRWTVAPRDTVISIGQQFTIDFDLFGCAGTQQLTDSLTFTSANPAVASVGAASGVVMGMSAGATTIRARANRYAVFTDIPVQVR